MPTAVCYCTGSPNSFGGLGTGCNESGGLEVNEILRSILRHSAKQQRYSRRWQKRIIYVITRGPSCDLAIPSDVLVRSLECMTAAMPSSMLWMNVALLDKEQRGLTP